MLNMAIYHHLCHFHHFIELL